MSIADELASKAFDKAPQVAEQTLQAIGKTNKGAIKGICLIIKASEFTTENVMKAVKYTALKTTKDIKYSSRNVSIEQLQKSGNVKMIEDTVTADVMKYFDDACKRYKVKYSAMKDIKDSDKPQYIVFYEGKSADVILQTMQDAYVNYIKAQEKVKNNPKEKGNNKDNERESVLAKLAFFRNRVADRDREQESVEKNRTHSEPQR